MATTNKLALVKQLVQAAKNNLETANQLLMAMGLPESAVRGGKSAPQQPVGAVQHTEQGAVIIEGVFDGQNMVGPDGKLYSVPANYASKSKLVEGDLLKLTISPDGSFIYKQIGPVERERLVGVLIKDPDSDDYRVMAQGRYYRVLLASITYFKAEIGDEVVILVPKATISTWAAVENVIKKGEGMTGDAAATISTTSDGKIVSTNREVKPKLAGLESTADGSQVAIKSKSTLTSDKSTPINKTEILPPFEI